MEHGEFSDENLFRSYFQLTNLLYSDMKIILDKISQQSIVHSACVYYVHVKRKLARKWMINLY